MQSTVATLQEALSRAYSRIKELETIAASANARAAEAVELADALKMRDIMRETVALAMQRHADISP